MTPDEFRSETLRRFTSWELRAHENLPLLEKAEDLRPKLSHEVAARAVAAGYVAAFCFGVPCDKVRMNLDQFSLWNHLSIEEQALFENTDVSPQAVGFHSWIVESIQFMMWALNLASLDHFAPCDDTLAQLIPKTGTDPTVFIRNAKLRPKEELLQEADTLYMLHWFAVEANLQGNLIRVWSCREFASGATLRTGLSALQIHGTRFRLIPDAAMGLFVPD